MLLLPRKPKKRDFEQKLEEEFPFMRRKEVTAVQWEKGVFSPYDAFGYEAPQGVTSIHMYAFANQKHLKKLVLPKSVRGLGGGAFSGCSNDFELVWQ